jgi:hypothetical protein
MYDVWRLAQFDPGLCGGLASHEPLFVGRV